MNLINIKDCSKCINSLVYGNSDNMEIQCISEDYNTKELFSKDGRCSAMYCKKYAPSNKARNGEIKQEDALRFLLAGNSDFILHSTKTDEDFRFLLTMQESNSNKNASKFIFFVNSIKANEKIYCGILWFDSKAKVFNYAQGSKGKVAGNSIDIRSLLFVLNKLYNKEEVKNLQVYSVGKCGCCGRLLETQLDVDAGVHKTCLGRINLDIIFENA